ncbi:TetR/AcrR family transcriptional regulator [Ideonella margarita]|uniref:TetR/AcrR family transcriptional regulator n=1 Tax=Ideonella margarita TaxID=2984191 RepID=A0ABU9CCC3_9BURK
MPSPSTRQRRKDARPQELLDAAMALFVEKGFAATKSEEVAARAGVSKGTLYLYFPSKEELLKAAIRHTLSADIAAGAQMAEAHTGSCSELLQDVMSAWWLRVYSSSSACIFKLVLTEVRNFPDIADFYLREVIEPGTAVITRMVQRGIDAGEFRPVDVTGTVHSIVLPMIMLCVHKHSLGACPNMEASLGDPELFIRQHMSLLLGGLRRPAAT